MSDSAIFQVAPGAAVGLEQVKGVVERKLAANLIKKRKQGNVELEYIGGHTVIRLLNEAFDYTWSFEIVTEEIVPSQPKPITAWNNGTKKKDPVLDANGVPKVEPQAPVVKVLGRLTVPGYGIKEQFGSKVLIGGATEQEAAFKSASTDALKKCATLFGIGLELYEDDDESEEAPAQQATTAPQKPAYQKPAATTSNPKPTSGGATAQWNATDIAKLKELKQILGISENPQLDPYVREFLDNPSASYQNISPTNVEAFNVYLGKKASAM